MKIKNPKVAIYNLKTILFVYDILHKKDLTYLFVIGSYKIINNRGKKYYCSFSFDIFKRDSTLEEH